MTSAELRQAFLQFFADRGHTIVASSPLVPGNDPTLLFTNAGMVQFKDVFLGDDKRSYQRATSSQRCVRAGGKHNDLENVGYTARHHTFFEMLGNFSFGDYFKKEAIEFAWEFVTQTLGLSPERLWVTVYEDDDEAADLWLKHMGVSAQRFSRLGEEDNFWSMGEAGPCGPCSEIFYDHGPDVPGGPPGSPDEDGDRYIEIWNLVFMQFDRSADGKMTPLPRPSVDTGMGLERVAAVMQGVHSNYEIDLFRNLLKAAATLVQDITGARSAPDLHHNSLQVIADHLRACSFLIVDGVLPGNEGRGYVLRRIIRRAIRHGYKLGVEQAFFHRLVPALVREMGEAYPELAAAKDHVEKILAQEEARFARTLSDGMGLLEGYLGKLKGKRIEGEVAFKLYDTYGFPIDLTADIAREHGLSVDQDGFETAMQRQREQSQKASQFGVRGDSGPRSDSTSDFLGYSETRAAGRVLELFHGGKPVDKLAAGDEGLVVLDRTPFYAESGGQVGDTGLLVRGKNCFEVTDTLKVGAAHGHSGRMTSGTLAVGDELEAHIDEARRQAIVLNHSATHLLHAALREELGDHVTQKGSLVAPDRLRFDFSHYEPLKPEQLARIEARVNSEIRANREADLRMMSYDAAIESGAMALFGEKYGDDVRVLSFGDFSTELCGGTHVRRTGDIGLFKIASETGIASGVRRVEALTGEGALAWLADTEALLRRLGASVKAGRDDLEAKVVQVVARGRTQEKEIAALKQRLASGQGSDLSGQAVDINGVAVLAAQLDGLDAKALRDASDQLRNKLGTAVIVLGGVEEGKVRLVATVSKDCIDRVKAGELVASVAEKVGGRGGGRPDMAQAGGSDPAALPAALAGVADFVRQRVT